MVYPYTYGSNMDKNNLCIKDDGEVEHFHIVDGVCLECDWPNEGWERRSYWYKDSVDWANFLFARKYPNAGWIGFVALFVIAGLTFLG